LTQVFSSKERDLQSKFVPPLRSMSNDMQHNVNLHEIMESLFWG